MSMKVLALGAAHLDRRARIAGQTKLGASNPGAWSEEAGGGAFNVSCNLVRMGLPVRLISPRGGDPAGEIVTRAAATAGIEDTPFIFLDRATPSYTAILEQDGNLVIGLADMELYRLFVPRRLKIRAVRDALAAAGAILCDANLPEETLSAIMSAAKSLAKPTFAIAISPAKVSRFKSCLSDLGWLFMNRAEAQELTGISEDEPLRLVAALRSLGLRHGVVTNSGKRCIAFDGTSVFEVTPPALELTLDVTGAGDSLAAGFMAALLSGMRTPDALRHGVASAVVNLASHHAVAENLTPALVEEALKAVPDAKILEQERHVDEC